MSYFELFFLLLLRSCLHGLASILCSNMGKYRGFLLIAAVNKGFFHIGAVNKGFFTCLALCLFNLLFLLKDFIISIFVSNF